LEASLPQLDALLRSHGVSDQVPSKDKVAASLDKYNKQHNIVAS